MDEIYFPPRELDVMSILWRAKSATVAEVRDALPEALAYTSVLSALQTLEEKGYVRHEGEGRAHRFYPLVERQAAGRSALRRVVHKLFGGSPELLLTQLVSDRDVSADDVRRMRALLARHLKQEEGA